MEMCMAAHYCLLAAFAIAYCTESAELLQDKIHMNRLETLLSRNKWFLCKRSEMKRGKCWPITEALKKDGRPTPAEWAAKAREESTQTTPAPEGPMPAKRRE